MLTDNGKEFTGQYCTTSQREPTDKHLFDKTCLKNSIEHRLKNPHIPQTHGMVERFNGRVTELVNQTRSNSITDLTAILQQYMKRYINHILRGP